MTNLRSIVSLFAVGTLTLAMLPSAAEPTDVVVAVGLTFVPGDDRHPELALTLTQGEELTFINLDGVPPTLGEDLENEELQGLNIPHTLTAIDFIPNTTTPLFDSGGLDSGESGPVKRTDQLSPGDYEFRCLIHPAMLGTLTVTNDNGSGGGNPYPY